MATALERLPGVKRADVKLETGQARVIYDDTKQTPEKLAGAIDRLGYKASLVSVAEAPTSKAPASERGP
ncbi:MAG: heavy-metal-associated domain-containing protein [Gemmatimonadota bacterium]